MRNPLPRPRHRRTPEFEELVDQIYRLMTQRDQVTEALPAQPGGPGPGTLSESPPPQATVDGLSGLAEILLGRPEGAADLADLADDLGLEVDRLLPLVDALVLLGFARLDGDVLELTPSGGIFAGASIQDSKEIFARASLQRVPLVRTIFRALRGSPDGNLPAGFFTDLLRTSVGEDEAARQLDVAVNWGRYAELYAYDATSGQIIREEHGIGATLADAEPARRGALHLFLGAAPGTGKTFTMLREGRALRDRGEDVVIGFVQTRGRPRTAEAIGGLEIIPPRPPSTPATGHGSVAADVPADPGEMNLDAVLARRPAVVLVDDFGQHTQAITALRDAGIDVLSTVDVCDLERAADTVRAMTQQPPAATVPDTALAEADDIRFVDSSPEALRKRLGHGNIYPPARAEAALTGLFSTANLAALREIGLQVVAETLTTPQATAQREPPDVLVAVTAPDQAGALIQRGIRLARPTGATCTVLLPELPAGAAAALQQAAEDAGATVIVRPGGDAAITEAVAETGAQHLVLPRTAAARRGRWTPGPIWRWPPSLAERLTDQLPDVHLHITPIQGGPPGDDGTDGRRAGRVASGQREQRRGAVRVYLGYMGGCGVTTAMLEEAGRRRSRGSDVVVAAVDCHDREAVNAALDGLELVGDGTTLDTAAVLARRPEVACVDDLSVTDPGGSETRLDAARRLAEAGINVVATVHLGSMRGHAGTDGGPLDEAAVLAFADELELVDAPPLDLADRARRGELGPAAGTEEALRTSYAPETLAARREQAFSIVAEHADRRLAVYRRGDGAVNGQAPPVILACAAPEPGMERLIRSAAALAARLAGSFLVATVVPAPTVPGLEPLLAGYAALAGQLGGQVAVRHGAPAAALTAAADEHQVTEMLLARLTPARAGHHPVLRELARTPGGAEVHVLPAEPSPERHRQGTANAQAPAVMNKARS